MDDKAILLAEYEEYIKRLGHKPSRIVSVMSVIKCFIKEGHDFERFQDYATFLEDHTIKKRSTYYYDVMKKFVTYTFKDDKETRMILLDTIKMVGKKRRDPKPRNSIITEEEQMRIIQNITTPKHQLIAWIQKETGVRAGDVIRLKRDYIKFGLYKDNDGITTIVVDITFVKKGDRVTTIPIFNPYLIDYLKVHLQTIDGDEEYAFIDRSVVRKESIYDDWRLENRNYYLYYQDLRKSSETLGYKVGQFATHDWRRNFANKVWIDVLKKQDIIALQRAMGHAHVDTTVGYLRQSGLESRDIFKHTYDLNK
jgi:integrase